MMAYQKKLDTGEREMFNWLFKNHCTIGDWHKRTFCIDCKEYRGWSDNVCKKCGSTNGVFTKIQRSIWWYTVWELIFGGNKYSNEEVEVKEVYYEDS